MNLSWVLEAVRVAHAFVARRAVSQDSVYVGIVGAQYDSTSSNTACSKTSTQTRKDISCTCNCHVIAVFHSSSQRTMINFKARKQIAQGWNLQGQDGWEPNRTTSSPVFGCGVCDSNAQRHIQKSEPVISWGSWSRSVAFPGRMICFGECNADPL